MVKNRWFRFKNIKISNEGDYVLQSVSNLETGSATKRKTDYLDTDGVNYSDIFYSERTFEIKGFIQAVNENEMVKKKRNLISRCSLKEPFTLEYCNRINRYSAECYFDKLPTFQSRVGWNLPFTLYLSIPGFYWNSNKAYSFTLYGMEDVILNDEFTLPCVFTKSVNEKTLINSGDCETYPVFTVTYNSDLQSGIIAIENITTDKKITINYTTSKGETLTVDTFNQTVTSSKNGNITGKITLDTEFFSLLKGENRVKADSMGNIITAEYKERFLGA